ncbi:T9SS type A sorting domain-containing protein [Dyadobacter sp. 3J3]|uniref:T9SS type A sorting domain-containing protein n=1 Tax=Dyadobacter sp. 3J3 TaxID=2606600 RepID=UPI0013596127
MAPESVGITDTYILKEISMAGKLIIINVPGQKVRQSDLTGSDQTVIDISTLSPGVYFYSLNNFTGSFIRK